MSELTACSQVGPSLDLLHSSYDNIFNRLPTLISLEVFHGDSWIWGGGGGGVFFFVKS